MGYALTPGLAHAHCIYLARRNNSLTGAHRLLAFGLIIGIELVGYGTETMIGFQILMLVLAVTGLVVGAVVAERQAMERALREREQALRDRESEIARLQQRVSLGGGARPGVTGAGVDRPFEDAESRKHGKRANHGAKHVFPFPHLVPAIPQRPSLTPHPF
mgnify:CR=1 FL=1